MVKNLTKSLGNSHCRKDFWFWFRQSKEIGNFVFFISQKSVEFCKNPKYAIQDHDCSNFFVGALVNYRYNRLIKVRRYQRVLDKFGLFSHKTSFIGLAWV